MCHGHDKIDVWMKVKGTDEYLEDIILDYRGYLVKTKDSFIFSLKMYWQSVQKTLYHFSIVN
ncbi:hypothetical protein Glove_13g241 [Diversispora epigaea]|uniref:Uncharacterized protein n=1 Tax=Diversispora epigaea TaxID=1348612 RepID=A0A397JPE5_9GLOM|nr:hypothetical protein Glove_13g241 [Diversispora epigaea]